MQTRGMVLAAGLVLLLVVSGCELLREGVRQLPRVDVTSPREAAYVDTPPIEGTFSGDVSTVVVVVDGQPYDARPGFEEGSWHVVGIPDLAPGPHVLEATATGLLGRATDRVTFAIGEGPFVVAFVPDRIVLEPTGFAGDGLEAETELFAFSADDDRLVRWRIASAPELEIDTDDLTLPPDGSSGRVMYAGGLPLRLGVRAPVDVPAGQYVLTVAAEAVDGSHEARARLVVEAARSRSKRYAVRSRVARTSIGGVRLRGRTMWDVTFDCLDGRCDASTDGGPREPFERPYDLAYDRADRSFSFAFRPARSGASPDGGGRGCDERVRGTLTPSSWDEVGPVRFEYRMTTIVDCDGTRTRVTWRGTGERR